MLPAATKMQVLSAGRDSHVSLLVNLAANGRASSSSSTPPLTSQSALASSAGSPTLQLSESRTGSPPFLPMTQGHAWESYQDGDTGTQLQLLAVFQVANGSYTMGAYAIKLYITICTNMLDTAIKFIAL